MEWYIANKSSTTYDPEFAELAMAFATAAYDEKCILDSFENQGFAVTTNKYSNQYNYLQPAYAIAAKTKENGDIIVAIVIRGSKSFAGWLTDFRFIPALGDNRHAGFMLAMETLMSQLEPISTNGKTKNFITGHSYGAAVANLLAAELIDRGVSQSSVYAYTFATPNVTIASVSSRNPSGKYNSIFNICNTLDLVPKVPLSLTSTDTWGKYGNTYSFTKEASSSSIFASHNSLLYLDFLTQQRSPDIKGYLGGTKSESVTSALFKFYLTGILCPVDVDIIDSTGELVAQFINNEPYYINNAEETLVLYTIGDEKYIISRADSNYTLKFTATDSGSMDYIVQDFNILSYEVSVTKAFIIVPLISGILMLSDVGGTVSASVDRLYVTESP